MNKIISKVCTGVLTVCLVVGCAVSCVDDEFVSSASVVEGQPITVSMKFAFNPGKEVVVTRNDDFAQISSLLILVYSGTGEFQKAVSISDGSLAPQTAIGGVLYEDVTFETTSGTKKLLAVANDGNTSLWNELEAMLKEQASEKTFEEMKQTLMTLKSGAEGMQPISIDGPTQMLMTGWNEGVEFSTLGAVTAYGSRGDDSQKVAIKLDRVFAHILFRIEAAPKGAKGTFTPTSYQVYNVPVNSYLTNTDHVPVALDFTFVNYASSTVGSISEGYYPFDFYMPENTYEVVDGVTNYSQRDQWDNGDENTTTPPEKKDWTHAPGNCTFVVISGTYTGNDDNYTGNVTYTVHLGDFGSSGSMGNFSVERNCRYTYTLQVLGVDKIVVEAQKEGEEDGYQQGAEGNIFDYKDCEYTYSLDAHYEQVYLQYNLSQIARAIPTGLQDDEQLDNAIADQLILVIQSEAMDYNHVGDDNSYTVQNKRGTLKPYRIYRNAMRSNGGNAEQAKADVLKGDGSGLNPTKGFDYRWVEFWPQRDEKQIAVYPGVPDWSRENVEDMANSTVYGGQPTEESKHLLDVYDVIVAMGNVVKQIYLKQNVTTDKYNDDGIIVSSTGNSDNPTYYARFTAFVNENYYYKHPLTHAKLTTWNVMTNKNPREMIIAMSTDVSEDGNNTYSKLYSYISQQSMQTFYNSREQSINAFGIESYNETPLTSSFVWGSPESTCGLDDTNGRSNQLTLVGVGNFGSNPDWGDYIGYVSGSKSAYMNNGWTSATPSDHKLPENAYNASSSLPKAYAACLSRNRDLNGNGTIEPNEVRWYLPSLNEYIRMSIGTNAVSSAARLYQGDKSVMQKNGYPSDYISQGSLYYTSSANNKRVYWAVERGSYGAEDGYYNAGSPLPVRCIRLLPGIEENQDLTSLSEDIVSASTYKLTNDNGLIVLDFSNVLDESLYRERVNDLVVHNEDNNANRFYDRIYVAKDFLPQSYRLGNIIGADGTFTWWGGSATFNGTKTNPCASYRENGVTGWRVPNLVELSAMNAAGLLNNCNDGYITICCTQFSNINVRQGFGRSSLIYCPGGEVANISSYFHIRCVRDAD